MDRIKDFFLDLSDRIRDLDLDAVKNFFNNLNLGKLLRKINLHVIVLGLILIIAVTIGVRLHSWNTNTKELDDIEDTGKFDRETLDNLVPYTYDAEAKDPEDMVIACFGNAPFADNMGKEDNLANIIAEKTNATVYNFGFPNSYLSCKTNSSITTANDDLFSLYWLTTVFALDNDIIVDNYLNDAPDTPLQTKATLSLLQNLDFNTVDVIAIMYDGSDYLDGRGMYNSGDSTNIQHFGGALEASIDLIHQTFPHIQVIVMSPPYAYALNADGTYADSTITTFGEGPLASYVQYESNVCYKMFASFVDTFYGSLSELDSDQVLVDNIHLSSEGRQRAAEEFMEAYNYYLKFRNAE